MFGKKAVIALLLMTVMLFTAACSNSPSESGGGKAKNELKVALTAAPPTLDLHRTSAMVTQEVSWHIFETLVTLNSKYEVVPLLAEKIEVSADGKTLTFPLRKDVTFHNDKALTADDVVASLDRWRKYSTIGRSSLAKGTITAKDPQTVVITLPQASGTVLPALATGVQGAVIMPKEIIEEAGDGNVKQFIGTGPFQFVEWKQDQHIHLKKFANYKSLPGEPDGLAGKREALVDDLYFIPVSDTATRVAGLQSGEFDFAEEIPFDNYETLKGDPNLVASIAKPSRYLGLIFNTKSGLFANQKMRQAVNAGVDCDAIMKAVTGNQEFYELDPGLMFKEQIWYVDSGKDKYNKKNLDQAKKMLAEAGYQGETVTILTTRDYDYMYKSAVVTKDQLEKLGMKVKMEVYDWPTLLSKRADDKAWNIFFTGFGIMTEPTQTLFLDSRNKWAGWYNDPKVDQLLDDMRGTTDFAAAKNSFAQAQDLFWEDVPVVKVGNLHRLNMMRKNVKGFHFFMENSYWNVSVK